MPKRLDKMSFSLVGGFTMLIMAIVILLAYQFIQSVPAETLGLLAFLIPVIPFMGVLAFVLVIVGFLLIVFYLLVRIFERGKKML